MKLHRQFVAVLLVLTHAAAGYAQQPSTPKPPAVQGGHGDLAQQAADPTAPLMAFRLRSDYVASYYGLPDSSTNFLFQPVIPFRAWGTNNLLRTTVTYDIDGLSGRGLSNVSIFDLIVFNKSWGRWGVGPLVSFSQNRGSGADTFSGGPAIGFVARAGRWNLGLFNQNLFGNETRFSSLQPVIAYNLGGGWTATSGDAQWGIDWTEPQLVAIPLGVQLAKVQDVGGQPVQFFVNPEYNARSIFGAPHWTVRFGLAILAPVQ